MSKYSYDLPDHKVTVKQLDPADLLVDLDVQRKFNAGRANKIAANLVESALGTFIVSQRETGEYYVVDGQHRRAACIKAGVKRVRCEVHVGLTKAHEGQLFILKNHEQQKTTALEEYRPGVNGGMPTYCNTDEILRKHDLHVGSVGGPNTVRSVPSIIEITDKYGPDTLDRVLTVAEAAWGRTAKTWDGMLLSGLGMLIGRHGDLVNDTLLVTKIHERKDIPAVAEAWVGRVIVEATKHGKTASGTGGRKSAAYNLMRETWNRGLRRSYKAYIAE